MAPQTKLWSIAAATPVVVVLAMILTAKAAAAAPVPPVAPEDDSSTCLEKVNCTMFLSSNTGDIGAFLVRKKVGSNSDVETCCESVILAGEKCFCPLLASISFDVLLSQSVALLNDNCRTLSASFQPSFGGLLGGVPDSCKPKLLPPPLH